MAEYGEDQTGMAEERAESKGRVARIAYDTVDKTRSKGRGEGWKQGVSKGGREGKALMGREAERGQHG